MWEGAVYDEYGKTPENFPQLMEGHIPSGMKSPLMVYGLWTMTDEDAVHYIADRDTLDEYM